MNVGYDVVAVLGEVARPVVAEVGRGDGEIDLLGRQLLAHVAEDVVQGRDGHFLAEKNLVCDDEALEGICTVIIEDVPHLRQLTRIGRLVLVLPHAQPYLDVLLQLELLDGVDDHLGLVAVGAVQADFIGELAQHSHVARDVVLRRRVPQAVGVLSVERSVVHAGENLVQIRILHEGLDLLAVDVEVAVLLGIIQGRGSTASLGLLVPGHKGADDSADNRPDDDEEDDDYRNPFARLAVALFLRQPGRRLFRACAGIQGARGAIRACIGCQPGHKGPSAVWAYRCCS